MEGNLQDATYRKTVIGRLIGRYLCEETYRKTYIKRLTGRDLQEDLQEETYKKRLIDRLIEKKNSQEDLLEVNEILKDWNKSLKAKSCSQE